jgi:hypothetical protein
MAAPALPRIAAYRPTIVWGAGTGVDTSEFDDVGGYALGDPGLAIDGIGRDQIRAYSPPKAPALDLTLSNHDGRFSPGGPLALFLGRGPAVTVDADWGANVLVNSPDVLVDDPRALVDGVSTMRLFTGTSVDMPQQIDLGQYAVSVTAVGTLQSLVTTRPTTILYENIRTDEAIAVLLDAAGWGADARSLDAGDTQLLAWWLDGQTTAMDALNAILMAEGAGSCAYEDGDGVFHFEGRQFRDNNPRSQTVQWACFDSARSANGLVDSPDVLVDSTDVLVDGLVQNALTYVAPSEYRSNPDEVVVSVAATVNTRTQTAVQQVWEYGGPLVLTSSQVLDVQVTASDPFKGAITPRDGTDYTITAGSALVGISLLTTSGQVATLRLTAPSGGCTVAGVTSNGIQVRATSLPVASSQTVTSTVNTALSTARQGSPNNPLVLGCWPEIERNQTLDLVNSMALRYQKERRQITFSLVNADAISQYAMFNIRPSDRVQFVHEHAQLNANFWVETVDYAVTLGGLMRLTLGCEQVFDLSGGRFDAAQFDVDVFGT